MGTSACVKKKRKLVHIILPLEHLKW